MTQPDDEQARRAASFGAVAGAYAEHRPDYPAAAIEWALGRLGQQPGRPARLLDLGAGTGKLTATLTHLVTGGFPATVIAVEPDEDMLAELRRRLPSVIALQGRAESIPLPDDDVDAVLVGQAVHWFDLDLAMPQIARVLRPGGVLAALWNADDDRADWVADLHQAIGRPSTLAFSSLQDDGGDEGDGGDEAVDWLGNAGRDHFWPPEEKGFEHAQRRTADSMIGTLRTHSTFLIMEPAEREAALARVRDYLAANPKTRDGEFSLPIYTFCGRTTRR